MPAEDVGGKAADRTPPSNPVPRINIILVLVGLMLGIISLRPAQARFGTDGVVVTEINQRAAVYSLALQQDGRIVAAGYSYDGADRFTLARYNPDGSLDGGFGCNGVTVTAFVGVADCYCMLVQPDGKILAGGGSSVPPWSPDQPFNLIRYSSDGSLDTSFGTNGKVLGSVAVRGLVLQPDGKIVTAYSADLHSFTVARHNCDGSLDTDFGGGGSSSCTFSYDADAVAIQRQADGKLLVAGYCYDGAAYCFALARFAGDGSLDPGFGNNGKAVTTIGPDRAWANSLILQPDGKSVVGGYFSGGGQAGIGLARYNSDGSLDSSFGSGGKVTTNCSTVSGVKGLVLQPDGKLAVASYGDVGSQIGFILARYHADGTLDTDFGESGWVRIPIGQFTSDAYCLTLQPDGKLVAAGHSNNNQLPDPTLDGGFALARVNCDGTLDRFDEPTPTSTQTPVVDFHEKQILAFPNPATDYVFFIVKLDRPMRVKAELFSIAGERVAIMEDTLSAVNPVLKWACGTVGVGIYLARINIGGEKTAILKVAVDHRRR